MDKLLDWWQRGVVAALVLSIAFLGIGRLEFFSPSASVSAWSISRTTFFFWFIGEILRLCHGGWAELELKRLKTLTGLYGFFIVVTLSLLPNFHQAGDYRYLFFGCAHAVMMVDVFWTAPQRRWIPLMLGIFPSILVVRGLLHDPDILHVILTERFGYPLDHANTAGYIFAMSAPVCVVLAVVEKGWWRGLSLTACATQTVGLVLTFSRGAWLGWIAAMVFLSISLKKWKLFAVFAVVPLAILLAFPALQARLLSVIHPSEDLAMRERAQRLASAVQLGMDHPVLGVGYGRGRLKESLPSYLKGTLLENSPVLHTHNVYVELFAETGAIGLLAFLWLIGEVLGRFWQSARARVGADSLLAFGFAASWVAALVTGLGDIPFYHHESRIYFFTLLGLAHLYAFNPDFMVRTGMRGEAQT